METQEELDLLQLLLEPQENNIGNDSIGNDSIGNGNIPGIEAEAQPEASSSQSNGNGNRNTRGTGKGKARGTKRKHPADASAEAPILARPTNPMTAMICGAPQLAELYEASRRPHGTNLALCARYIAEVLSDARKDYAFFGGYAMTVRGAARSTVDVDVLVSTDPQSMVHILTEERCIFYPEDRVVGNFPRGWNRMVFHVYVNTKDLQWLQGPKDLQVEPQIVSVYLILCGGNITNHMSLPPELPRGAELISVVPGLPMIRVIGVSWQLLSKLRAYRRRRIGRFSSHFNDIIHLALTYNPEICTWREGLRQGIATRYLRYARAFLQDLVVETKLDVTMQKITAPDAVHWLRRHENMLTSTATTTLERFNALPCPMTALTERLALMGIDYTGFS